MDRRILFALAAVAGVCAAILLFPARDKVDADVAVGQDHAPSVTRSADDEPPKPRINQVPTGPLPGAKEAAAEASEARRATPYYQHAQAVGKHWMQLSRVLGGQGDEENATRAREVSRALRAGSRPDGDQATQDNALELEGQLLTEFLSSLHDGEAAQMLVYIKQAYDALEQGQPPPAYQGGAAAQEEDQAAEPGQSPGQDDPEDPSEPAVQ